MPSISLRESFTERCASCRRDGADAQRETGLLPAPELFARQSRAFDQGPEFGPANLRIAASTDATVDAGDDVFFAHEIGVADDAIRDQLRRLHRGGLMCDHTRVVALAIGQFEVLPELEVQFVPH